MAQTQRAATMRERIGGRWAISWQANLVGSILIIVLITLAGTSIGAERSEAQDTGRYFLAALAGVGALNAYSFLASATVFRNRGTTPVALPVVLAYHFGLGFLFGVTLAYSLPALGVEEQTPWWVLGAGFGVGAVLWCTTISLVLDSDERFDLERAALIDRAVDLELLRLDEIALLREMTRITGPEDGFDVATVPATGSLLPLDTWWGISADARGQDRDFSLTRRIRTAAQRRYPRVTSLGVLRAIITRGEFRPMVVALTLAVVLLPEAFTRLGALGLTSLAGVSLLIAGLTWAANVICRHRPEARLFVHVVTFLLILTAVSGYLAGVDPLLIRTDARIESLPVTEMIAAVLITSAIVIATMAASIVDTDRASLLQRFTADTNFQMVSQVATVRQIAARARSRAMTLPPPRGEALLRCAQELEDAVASSDVHLVRQGLAACHTALFHSEQPSLAEAVAHVITPWTAVGSITIDLDENISEVWMSDDERLVRIIDEGIANAFRHGDAQTVHVEAHLVDISGIRCARVVISDDGRGSVEPTPGVGSTLFDELSEGSWTLRAGVPAGSILTVDLPMTFGDTSS